MNLETIETREQAQQVIDKFDVFIFDIDGVLYLHETPIPLAKEALLFLQNDCKKKLVFVTNNATRTRAQILAKFEKILQIPAHVFSEKQFFTSASLIADYLQMHGAKHCYLIGEGAFKFELESRNIKVFDSSIHDNELVDEKKFHNFFLEPPEIVKNFDSVIVGFDRRFNLYKCYFAALILQVNEKAHFLAGNKEKSVTVAKNTLLPHAIVMVSAVEAATFNRKATVVCKPSADILPVLKKETGVEQDEKFVMIGDSLDADIELAKNCKIASILVETGKSSKLEANQWVKEADCKVKPLILSSIGKLYELCK